MLHFCSFTVFSDPKFGPYLVFESNIDGSPSACIEALCAFAAQALHDIYVCCPDYRSAGADPAYLRRYLRRRIVRAAAAFVGDVAGRPGAFAAKRSWSRDPSVSRRLRGLARNVWEGIVAAVRDHVRADSRWDWVWQPPPRLSAGDRVARWIGLICRC